MARWFRCDLSGAGPFVCQCLTSRTMLRFHFPRIEPDLPISSIRLSDHVSRLRSREAGAQAAQSDHAQLVVQIRRRETPIPTITYPMLRAPPLTEPGKDVPVDTPPGVSDRAYMEIVRPPIEDAIQDDRHLFRRPAQPLPTRFRVDPLVKPSQRFPRRPQSQIGGTRSRRSEPPERVAQEIERFPRQPAKPRLLRVDRQPQPLHHALHRRHSLLGRAVTTDYEVVGVIDNRRPEPPFMAQHLPTQDETSHVEVAQQR